jgi:hypothetical protein
VTPEEQVLLRVIEQLDQLEIPYMVAGSLASSHHGRPRATHDADVVIAPSRPPSCTWMANARVRRSGSDAHST